MKKIIFIAITILLIDAFFLGKSYAESHSLQIVDTISQKDSKGKEDVLYYQLIKEKNTNTYCIAVIAKGLTTPVLGFQCLK